MKEDVNKAYQRQYYALHAEEIKARRRAQHKQGERNGYAKRYYKANIASRTEYQREYYAVHAEEIKAKRKAKYQQNKSAKMKGA